MKTLKIYIWFFIYGVVTGSLLVIALLHDQSTNLISIFFQITAGILLYFFGLPPKRYYLEPKLIIGNLNDEQKKTNFVTESYSFLGIALFLLGQAILVSHI